MFALLLAFHSAVATNVAMTSINNLRHQVKATPASEVKQVHHALVAASQPGPAGPTKEDKREPMDMINEFRAEVCANLKDEHGKNFESYDKCKDFMFEACNPGKDKSMDGDGKEITTGSGYCEEYFAAKKAEEEVKKRGGTIPTFPVAPAPAPGGPGPAPAPAPVPSAPAPAPKVDTPAPAPAKAGSAPAPAPVGGPSPAPSPVPLADDEAWYFKKGGKSAGRLHMNEDMKLPSQGYWGKLVGHDDQKTITGDWGKEFGAKSGHKTYAEICKLHPHNQWCLGNGYGVHKASGRKTVVSALALMMPFVFALA